MEFIKKKNAYRFVDVCSDELACIFSPNEGTLRNFFTPSLLIRITLATNPTSTPETLMLVPLKK